MYGMMQQRDLTNDANGKKERNEIKYSTTNKQIRVKELLMRVGWLKSNPRPFVYQGLTTTSSQIHLQT